MVLRIALHGWLCILGCRHWRQHLLTIWLRLSSHWSCLGFDIQLGSCQISIHTSNILFENEGRLLLTTFRLFRNFFWRSLVLVSTIWRSTMHSTRILQDESRDMEVTLCTKFDDIGLVTRIWLVYIGVSEVSGTDESRPIRTVRPCVGIFWKRWRWRSMIEKLWPSVHGMADEEA